MGRYKGVGMPRPKKRKLPAAERSEAVEPEPSICLGLPGDETAGTHEEARTVVEVQSPHKSKLT